MLGVIRSQPLLPNLLFNFTNNCNDDNKGFITRTQTHTSLFFFVVVIWLGSMITSCQRSWQRGDCGCESVCVCVFVNCLLLIRAHLSRDERSNLSGRRQIRATSWPFSPWLDFSYPNLSGYVVHQYSDKNIVNTCTVKHELKNNICKLEFLQLCSSANQWS